VGRVFLMAGGGTGGHVIPALAVARELRDRGHAPVFVGTTTGFEAKLVPAAGFPIEWIDIGGLKRVGVSQTVRTLRQLPVSIRRVFRVFEKYRPAAVFSMGGYVAGPVMLAASLRRLPLVVMEPNALPGFTNRRMGRFVTRALLSFPETARYFRRGRSEVTGVPVRPEFFTVPARPADSVFTVLITGGSQGSRTLNNAARESWPYFRESGEPIHFLHQTGVAVHEEIAAAFAQSGLRGEISAFIQDMPAAFAEADLIVSRSGAGAVAEIAAAGKPSILAPFPFAADDHQLKNAQAFARAGAARVILDRECNGKKLFEEINALRSNPTLAASMARNARAFAKPGAATRAAEILEQVSIDLLPESRNN